jgi:hypothetical protein
MTWTSTKTLKTVSGFLKIDFLTPDIKVLDTSNFKSDNIQSLSNLLIDLTTLTFAYGQNLINKSVAIIKTNDLCVLTKENIEYLKNDLEKYCLYNKDTPTFLYLKHKDNKGHFYKHFSNYDTQERTVTC